MKHKNLLLRSREEYDRWFDKDKRRSVVDLSNQEFILHQRGGPKFNWPKGFWKGMRVRDQYFLRPEKGTIVDRSRVSKLHVIVEWDKRSSIRMDTAVERLIRFRRRKK